MAVLPRHPGLLALAVALLLAATGGCLCRSVPSGVPSSRALLSTPPAPPDTPAPPPFHFPRPICRLCPPRCPPEGCSGGRSP
ncbi:hypothetical protein GQ55_1G083800 [Panicum hallii var. hallii]|uniref:Epidermal patterning factor-like protein n=2 Tax=Panicum hallii TaxID=206008 RepID=A0A2T7F3L8_9POAL|nr:hypothetical protein PAHAL_1G085600 [Panicum hallii]PUZ74666.1 hypothetical protein GQ55_1G083800 [Panicum hallii var. hallii]